MPVGPVNAGIETHGPCINVHSRLNAEFDTETRSATASTTTAMGRLTAATLSAPRTLRVKQALFAGTALSKQEKLATLAHRTARVQHPAVQVVQ